MVKHTQTIRRQIADELFEYVWPVCGIKRWIYSECYKNWGCQGLGDCIEKTNKNKKNKKTGIKIVLDTGAGSSTFCLCTWIVSGVYFTELLSFPELLRNVFTSKIGFLNTFFLLPC